MRRAVDTVRMDRSSPLYAVLHYALLIGLILLVVAGIEATVASVDLLAGVVIAVAVGVLYPAVVRRLDLAPEHWER